MLFAFYKNLPHIDRLRSNQVHLLKEKDTLNKEKQMTSLEELFEEENRLLEVQKSLEQRQQAIERKRDTLRAQRNSGKISKASESSYGTQRITKSERAPLTSTDLFTPPTTTNKPSVVSNATTSDNVPQNTKQNSEEEIKNKAKSNTLVRQPSKSDKVAETNASHLQWREVIDPNTGKSYYFNLNTRETTWKVPPDFIPAKNRSSTFSAGKDTQTQKASAPTQQPPPNSPPLSPQTPSEDMRRKSTLQMGIKAITATVIENLVSKKVQTPDEYPMNNLISDISQKFHIVQSTIFGLYLMKKKSKPENEINSESIMFEEGNKFHPLFKKKKKNIDRYIYLYIFLCW